jgi:hypothetical protein
MNLQEKTQARRILGHWQAASEAHIPQRSATGGQRSQRPKRQADESHLESELESNVRSGVKTGPHVRRSGRKSEQRMKRNLNTLSKDVARLLLEHPGTVVFRADGAKTPYLPGGGQVNSRGILGAYPISKWLKKAVITVSC